MTKVVIFLPLACPACVLAARLSMRRKSIPYLASVDAASWPGSDYQNVCLALNESVHSEGQVPTNI